MCASVASTRPRAARAAAIALDMATLAGLFAHVYDAEFIPLSAVLAGVKDVRSAVDHARMVKSASGKPTILFLDEVHRFNKAQQDAFLPFVEDGTLVFIGATTENPSFELNSALLSRCTATS
jgi:putative ATPase